MEITLEPSALGVARFDDTGTRRAKILQLSPRLSLEALVLEREASRRRDLFDELGVVEEVGSVKDHRDGPALTDQGCRRAPVHRSGVDRPPARVRVAALADRIGELELRIGQRLGEPVPQAAWGSRLAELDDEARKGRARAASPKQAPCDGGREGGQRSRLGEPEPSLELAAPDEPTVETRDERRRDEDEVDAAGDDDRRDDALPRPARARNPPRDDHDQEKGPGKAEMDAEPAEIVVATGLVGDEQEIVRALDAAERRRVEEESRQQAQHKHGAGDGKRYGDSLLPGLQPAPGVGKHRPGCERRTRCE